MARTTRIDINVTGDKEFSREMLRFSTRAMNMQPAFEEIIEQLREWVRGQYRTNGFRSGEPWRPLSPVTVAIKKRRGLDPRIMLATHDLYNSLAHKSADSIADVDPDGLEFGSKLDYFKYHQSRKPRTRLPRRPVVGLTELDKQQIVKILQAHIVSLRSAIV